MEGRSENISSPAPPAPSPKTATTSLSTPQQVPKQERESPPAASIATPMSMTPIMPGISRKRKSHPDVDEPQQTNVQIEFIDEGDVDADGDADAEGDEVDEEDIVKVPTVSRTPPRSPRDNHQSFKRSHSPPGSQLDLGPESGSEYESGRIKCDSCGTEVPFRDPRTGDFNLADWNRHKTTCSSAVGSRHPRAKPSHHQHHHHPHSHSHGLIPTSRAPVPHQRPQEHFHCRHSSSRSPPQNGPFHHQSQLGIGRPPHPHYHQHPQTRPTLPHHVSERDPVILTPESAASALAQPPTKRRRAKRTEEERINYLKNDPYVASFEAYRVLCASCDKWIRLRPNSTYCSIPWDAHRKSCLAKKISSKNTYALEERNSLFSKDPDVRKFDAERVLCAECDQWIGINPEDHLAAVQKWLSHKSSCRKLLGKADYHPGQVLLSPELPSHANGHPHAYPPAQRSPPNLPKQPGPTRGGSPLMSHLPHPHQLPPPRDFELRKAEPIKRRRGSNPRSGRNSPYPHPSVRHSYDHGHAYPSPEDERYQEHRDRPETDRNHPHTSHTVALSRSATHSPVEVRRPSPREGSHASRTSPGVSGGGSVGEDAAEEHRESERDSAGATGSSTSVIPTSSSVQESRRRNAEQRAATLRADELIETVEPNRVFCSLCQKWVQLRQDSSYCAYPWIQHKGKCLTRHKRRIQKAEDVALLKREREAVRTASHARRQGQSHSRPSTSHSASHYTSLHHITPPYGDLDELNDSDIDLLSQGSDDSVGWDARKDHIRHEHLYGQYDTKLAPILPSRRQVPPPQGRAQLYTSASNHHRHIKIDEDEGEIIHLGAIVGGEADAELDVDAEFEQAADRDAEADSRRGEGDEGRPKGRTLRPLRKANASRRNPNYPYSSRAAPSAPHSPPPISSKKQGGRTVAILPATAVLPPQLADLDSAAGRKNFVHSSINYLFQTTYEATDDMSISTLLTYLNAAMPPDKHEDFDTAEVAKAVGASGEKARYVLEGDLVRRA